MTETVDHVRQITLKSTPRTVHLVKAPMLSVPNGVTTFCGRKGFAYEPTYSAWRHCRACIRAQKEAENE